MSTNLKKLNITIIPQHIKKVLAMFSHTFLKHSPWSNQYDVSIFNAVSASDIALWLCTH